MTAIWKDVVGFEGRFQVSDHGRFRSTKKMLKVATSNRHYATLCVRVDRKTINFHCAREVAKAFLGPSEDREVNHIDGDKLNNHVSNLEWVTRRENHIHRARVLGKGQGETHAMAVLSDEQVKGIFLDPRPTKELVAEYGVTDVTINRIRRRAGWTHVTKDLAAPKRKYGSKRPNLTEQDIVEVRKLLMQGKTNKEIAEAFSLDPATVSNIKHGKRRAGGVSSHAA